jgi:hypothetical protein
MSTEVLRSARGLGCVCANLAMSSVVTCEILGGQGRKLRGRLGVRGSRFAVVRTVGQRKRMGLMGHMGPILMYRSSQNVLRREP